MSSSQGNSPRVVDLEGVFKACLQILRNQGIVKTKTAEKLASIENRLVRLEEMLVMTLQSPEKKVQRVWSENETVCRNRIARIFLALIPDVFSCPLVKEKMKEFAQELLGQEDPNLAEPLSHYLWSRLEDLRSNLFRTEEQNHAGSFAKNIPRLRELYLARGSPDLATGEFDEELEKFVLNHLQAHNGLSANDDAAKQAFKGNLHIWRHLFRAGLECHAGSWKPGETLKCLFEKPGARPNPVPVLLPGPAPSAPRPCTLNLSLREYGIEDNLEME